jgi:hypothetical protein
LVKNGGNNAKQARQTRPLWGGYQVWCKPHGREEGL